MGKATSQGEREFYYRKLGAATPQKPLNQLARDYYLSYLGSNVADNKTPLDQLETVWAKQFIRNNGGTPPSGNNHSQLWRQLVVVIGKGSQASKYLNDNRLTFFLNAP